jgi:predicted N-acetyltransferase YhbS
VHIRQLTTSEEDFKKVVDFLIENFVPEHKMGKLSASNLNLKKALGWVIFNIKEAAFVVEDNDGKVVGSIGLNRTSPWYSDAEYIADGWLYVLQEYRKSGVAGMLIDKAKEFAEEKELPLIIGIFSKEDAIAKAGIMNKLGLITVGGLFAAGV